MITFIESGNRIATENFETGEIYTITYTNGNYRTMCCIGIGTDFVMFQGTSPNALFCLTLGTSETVSTIELGGGGSGTMNYNELENKPQINGIVLIGNKTASDLNLVSQNDLDNYVTDTELSTELADYATNASVVSALASKQDTLTTTQLTAVNSGITSSLVSQITTNQNNISINSIKSSITMGQGYTLVSQSTLYQQGKHIFGNLIIKKNSGNYSDTSETVCTLGKPPAITSMLFCGFGASEWGIESIGYAFLGSTGGVSVKDTKTTNTTVNIAVDYVIS